VWALERHLLPRLGNRQLAQITPEDVARLIADMRKSGLKSWTITSALRPLSIIYGEAARRGRIASNPVSQLDRRERPKHDDQRDKRILSLAEMRALVEHADSDEYRALFELLLAGGLRIGEALGLSVADLDTRHSVVRIEYQLGRDGTRQPLKTDESRRAVDIPPQLMRKLLTIIDDRGARFTPNALVFVSRTATLECVSVHVIGPREGSHVRGNGIGPLLEQHRQILVPQLPQHASHQTNPRRSGRVRL
jgi:integrase